MEKLRSSKADDSKVDPEELNDTIIKHKESIRASLKENRVTRTGFTVYDHQPSPNMNDNILFYNFNVVQRTNQQDAIVYDDQQKDITESEIKRI